MGDRDTHFQGFARLLLIDITRSPEWPSLYRFLSDETIQQIKTVIAQRAFDLAEHVYNHTTESMTAFSSFAVIAEENDIPDLTEWPSPPET